MKKGFSLIIICNLLAVAMWAQATRQVRVRAGEDAAQVYSPTGFYRFPQFGKATLYYGANARRSDILFNYNLLSGALQFINPKGDTLDLANPIGIDSVVFEQGQYVYSGGFLEVVDGIDSLRLLKKMELRVHTESIGAYGHPNPTGAITNIKNITAGTTVYNLVVNQDVVLTEDSNLFFLDKNGALVKASKSNLFKLLPADKQVKAEPYLKKKKVNFDRENDVKALFSAIRS